MQSECCVEIAVGRCVTYHKLDLLRHVLKESGADESVVPLYQIDEHRPNVGVCKLGNFIFSSCLFCLWFMSAWRNLWYFSNISFSFFLHFLLIFSAFSNSFLLVAIRQSSVISTVQSVKVILVLCECIY